MSNQITQPGQTNLSRNEWRVVVWLNSKFVDTKDIPGYLLAQELPALKSLLEDPTVDAIDIIKDNWATSLHIGRLRP
jgi:hypothetical protein